MRDACALLSIEVTPSLERGLSAMRIAELNALREKLQREKRWD